MSAATHPLVARVIGHIKVGSHHRRPTLAQLRPPAHTTPPPWTPCEMLSNLFCRSVRSRNEHAAAAPFQQKQQSTGCAASTANHVTPRQRTLGAAASKHILEAPQKCHDMCANFGRAPTVTGFTAQSLQHNQQHAAACLRARLHTPPPTHLAAASTHRAFLSDNQGIP